MTVGTLDRRSIVVLAAGLLLILTARYALVNRQSGVVEATESAPVAEKRLALVRQKAATAPGREAVLKLARAELATREAGLLKADTKEQAEALLLEQVQNIAKANGIDARGNQAFREKLLGGDYAEVSATVSFTCGIEQLVNLLAALADQPEILATEDMRIAGGADKKKNVQVQLSVTGVVPRRLIPQKKGGTAF